MAGTADRRTLVKVGLEEVGMEGRRRRMEGGMRFWYARMIVYLRFGPLLLFVRARSRCYRIVLRGRLLYPDDVIVMIFDDFCISFDVVFVV